MSKRVLFVEWSTFGRDFEIDLPLMYFCEKVLKFEVEYISIFNLNKIISKQPDIVIMSNTTGARINNNMAKLINQSGFCLFSHVSEGMYRKDTFVEAFWGHNQDRVLYENRSMQWSERCTKLISETFNGLASRTPSSGSVGHDKYRIFTPHKLSTYGFKKVIGYAGFDFHNLADNEQIFIELRGEGLVRSHQRNALKLKKILNTLIRHYPDVLFILKAHPGDRWKTPIEMEELDKYPNVKIYSNEYSIFDVIATCDLWLNYASSTNLEAWLLEKPSISLCNDETILRSAQACHGSVISGDTKKLRSYIDEFYANGRIQDFDDKKEVRKKLIKDLIGFDDGLNHVRLMSFLKPYINSDDTLKGRWNVSWKKRLKSYIKHILCQISKGKYNTPLLKRWARPYDIFNPKDIKIGKELRYPEFDTFYNKHWQQIDDIYNNYADSIKKEMDWD